MSTINITTSGDFNEFRRHIEADFNQWRTDCEREARRRAAQTSAQGKFHQRERPQRAERARRSTGKPPMPMTRVHSSIIAEVGYDPKSQQLCLVFVSGDQWLYHSVPPWRYRMFQESPSLGSFFNRHIKGTYRAQRL